MARRKKSYRQQKATRQRKKANREKSKGTVPDEVFQHGPLRMARFGNFNVFENLATPEQMKEIHECFGARYDEVCKKISSHVARCRAVVSVVDPIRLLVRCYWNYLVLSLEAPAEESQQSHERNEAFQLLEYTQKLVCGLGPVAVASEATNEQFHELTAATREVFLPLQVEYYLCRSGRLTNRTDYDFDLDEYAVRNEMSWLGVRGWRYLSHEANYFRKILGTQSDLLEGIYGVTAEAIADGVERILVSLSKGVGTVMEELDAFRTDTLNAIEQDSSLTKMSPPEAMKAIVEKNGWQNRQDSIFSRLFGADLFEVERLTGWPTELIEDLSLEPSEDTGFVDTSSESAWPTKFSQTHFAPFVRQHGKSYCFNIYGVTDRLYRALERGIRKRQSSKSERWNRGQKRASENLTAELFSRLLPGADVYTDGHYWVTDHESSEIKWTDCDLIVAYDRQLFVVEVKGGRYTYKAPSSHIRDHIKSLKELIENAASQANRFVDQLELHKELVVHNAKRETIATLRHDDFDHFTRCCITLDQIDDIASRSEDLAKLNIDIGPHPIWTVSINDLLVLADVFTNPLIFVDYLRERLRAFASPICHVSDELDHAGLYLEHNRYVMRAEEFAPMESMGWGGYRDAFDRYYSALWHGRRGNLPTQEMPLWMDQVLNLLAQSRKSGRVRVAELLLSMDEETRNGVSDQVARVLKLQKHQERPRPFSTAGDVRLTISVSQKGAYHVDFTDAHNHALAVMTLQKEKERIMIWLQYSVHEVLEDVQWALLSEEDAAAMDSKKLAEAVRRLQASRGKLDPSDIRKFRTH